MVLLQEVFRILAEYIVPRDTLVIGVSGGPDSTALLHLLRDFSKKTPCTIIVAHVNHGIRGAASDTDEKFVEKMAKTLGLTFRVKRVKLVGSALESKGREVRRAFFEQLSAEYKATHILTAHTQDDNVETILFNFLRGSGPAGLAGMQIKNGLYLKPLLAVSKKDILAYLKKHRIKFCTDASNKTTVYTRNFLRLKVLPLLRRVNSSLEKTVINNAETFRQLDDYLTEQARAFLRAHGITNAPRFPRAAFIALPAALQTTVLQEAYLAATGKTYRLAHIRIREIIQLIHKNVGKKRIIVSDGAFVLDKGVVSFVGKPL